MGPDEQTDNRLGAGQLRGVEEWSEVERKGRNRKLNDTFPIGLSLLFRAVLPSVFGRRPRILRAKPKHERSRVREEFPQ